MENQEEEVNDVSRVSGSSSSWSRFPVSTLKLAVEIFDDTGHFGMGQGEVLDSFFQQALYKFCSADYMTITLGNVFAFQSYLKTSI